MTNLVNMCKITIRCFWLFFFFADIGYESLINLMLKDLFKLLVSCVSEPAETISRVGCSCIRSDADWNKSLSLRILCAVQPQ